MKTFRSQRFFIDKMFNFFKAKKEEKEEAMVDPFMIVGLGNPGRKYEKTRHNAGFLAIDYLCAKHELKCDRLKFQSLYQKTKLCGKDVIILKPQTFMNLSGRAVLDAANFFNIPPENIVVLCDDVNLESGTLRIREKGSDGGHNGLKNIIYLLGRDDFPRIRIGVSLPKSGMISHVLGEIPKEEQEKITDAIKRAVSAAEYIISGEIGRAQNEFNQKPEKKKKKEQEEQKD